jgi:hypothetical protein
MDRAGDLTSATKFDERPMQEQQHSHTAIAGTDASQSTIGAAGAEGGDAGANGHGQEEQIGFGARGRTRRRVRFLRKARELAYRDLGGLVFNLHRFGQRNDPLVVAKLSMLDRIDSELRTLESTLEQRQPVTVLREAGITACPRCAAIHASEDRFCPNCGLPVGRHADLPIGAAAGAPSNGPPGAPVQAPESPATPPPQPVVPAPSPASDAPADASPPRTAAGGRSPSPPATASPPDSTATPAPARPNSPMQAASPPPGQDEPTEILRPPTASQ